MGNFDFPSADPRCTRGDPVSLLPLLHYILMEYSPLLTQYLASKKYEFYAKTDQRFIELVYKLCRDEFGYKPVITKEQFFQMGFAERKMILVMQMIQFCCHLTRDLNRKGGKNENVKKISAERFIAQSQLEHRIECQLDTVSNQESDEMYSQEPSIQENSVDAELNHYNAASIIAPKGISHGSRGVNSTNTIDEGMSFALGEAVDVDMYNASYMFHERKEPPRPITPPFLQGEFFKNESLNLANQPTEIIHDVETNENVIHVSQHVSNNDYDHKVDILMENQTEIHRVNFVQFLILSY